METRKTILCLHLLTVDKKCDQRLAGTYSSIPSRVGHSVFTIVNNENQLYLFFVSFYNIHFPLRCLFHQHFLI